MHPTLLHLGHFTIPTFGVLAALGLISALSLTLRCASLAHLQPDTLWDATLLTAVAAFIISRLLLVVSDPHSFLAYPVILLSLPSLTGIGLLLTGVSALAYLRFRGIPILNALDAWAAPATLLWAFLALGHLAEGSDAGLPSRAPWAVRIPPDPDLQQPIGLFAAVGALAITIALVGHLRRRQTFGHTAALALLLTGVVQFFLTFGRQPYPYAPDAPPLPLDPIQFLSLAMVVAGGLLYLNTPRSRMTPETSPLHPERAPKEAS